VPKVITRSAIIQCPHSGIGQSIPAQTSVLVGGSPVLVDGDTGVIQNCLNLPPVGVPCAGYVLRSMNLNAVTVGGRRALIDTDFQHSSTGYPLAIREFHQVEDLSLPVMVPPGGTFTTPPELQDTDQPTITALPLVLAFSKIGFSNTGAPSSLTITLTLNSQFPNQWMLTMIAPPSSTDITSSAPPGLTVQPSGGSWTVSPITVTVTLTGVYMTTLPVLPAKVSFVMVGINRRGRSAVAETVLGVSP
jgi:hypothetical protein